MFPNRIKPSFPLKCKLISFKTKTNKQKQTKANSNNTKPKQNRKQIPLLLRSGITPLNETLHQQIDPPVVTSTIAIDQKSLADNFI